MKVLKTSFMILLIFMFLTGCIYPLAMTGMGRMLFPRLTGGSLVYDGSRVIGSELIGQSFTALGYFHGRPSAGSYDGLTSGGSNLGPTSRKLIEQVKSRAAVIRGENGMTGEGAVPADLVLASGSGLDPHISLAGALAQVPRIARERNMDEKTVAGLVMSNALKMYFDIWGESHVNVLVLNRALDYAQRE